MSRGAQGGAVVGWGYSGTGIPQPTNLTDVVALSSYYHVLALRSNGTVVSWGDTTAGQTTVPPGLTNVTAVSAGTWHSLALLANGQVVQWGASFMPPAPSGLNDAMAIGTGTDCSFVVRSNGTVLGWGFYTPATNIPPGMTNAVAVAGGQDFAVVLTSDGRVVAWGQNDAGQTNVPASATDVVAIDASTYAAQALRSDGTIVYWGGTNNEAPPPTGLSNVISMGDWRALKSDHTVAAWGSSDNQPAPVGLSNVIAVATGPGRSYVVVQVDDQHPPVIVSQDVRILEGNNAHQITIPVWTTVPFQKPVSFYYQTADGTASAGKDYAAGGGQVVFPAFATNATLSVTILGDVLRELDRTFYVNFSSPSNGVLYTNQINVSIVDDDTLQVPAGFGATALTTNLMLPTALDVAPDGRVFVCEQRGNVRIIENGALLSTPFLSLPVTTEDDSEAGLLGIAFDPNFSSNHYLYVYYTVPGIYQQTPDHNRISRFTAQGDSAATNSEYVLLDLDPLASPQQHNGGAIHFGPDGTLYAGVGDDGSGTNSQTLTNLFGKILRINADGSIPFDNPFYQAAEGKYRAIWALGLRNPFSFAFQPLTGRLLINDVGLSTWEEIDEGHAGLNYGWPYVEGPSANPAYQNPVFAYGHSGTNSGCAIVAGVFYCPTNSNFPADFFGNYLFADYCSGWLRRLTNGNMTADFISGLGPTVGLKVGTDGALYVLRRGVFNGTVYRISWKDPMQIQTVVRTAVGTAQLSATARTNHTYVLDTSTNLINWTSIQTNLATGNNVIFLDPAAGNFNRRFYRLHE